MRKLLMALMLFQGWTNCIAQNDVVQTIPERGYRDRVVVKILPLSLFDFDNTIQLGVEIPLKNRRFTIQQEAGYGHSKFNVWYSERGNRPDKNIFKTRTQLRYYFYEKKWMRSYVAGEYLFKRVINSEAQWVGQDCAGNCGYFEYMDVRYQRLVNAGHAKVGWQFYFPGRVTIDFHTGLGFRNINTRKLTLNAENAQLYNDWMMWNAGYGSTSPRVSAYPSLVIGFQIGIMLGKLNRKPVDKY